MFGYGRGYLSATDDSRQGKTIAFMLDRDNDSVWYDDGDTPRLLELKMALQESGASGLAGHTVEAAVEDSKDNTGYVVSADGDVAEEEEEEEGEEDEARFLIKPDLSTRFEGRYFVPEADPDDTLDLTNIGVFTNDLAVRGRGG